MSLFEIPPAQVQFNNEANAETWYEVINAGMYLKNGQEFSASVNAEDVLGYEPLFSVGTINVWNDNGQAVTEIPAPGRGSRGMYLAYPITKLSLQPDIPGGFLYNLGLSRPFNNAGDSLRLASDGSTPAGLVAPSTALYRFCVSFQGDFVSTIVDLTSSSYAVFLVVQRNGTTPSQYIVPAGVVEFAGSSGDLYSNRASLTTEVALEQGDVVTVFVGWMYSDTPLLIKKVLWSASKLTLDSPAN